MAGSFAAERGFESLLGGWAPAADRRGLHHARNDVVCLRLWLVRQRAGPSVNRGLKHLEHLEWEMGGLLSDMRRADKGIRMIGGRLARDSYRIKSSLCTLPGTIRGKLSSQELPQKLVGNLDR